MESMPNTSRYLDAPRLASDTLPVGRETSTEERMALFKNFQKSAFRLETLDQYVVTDEWPQFQAYLLGDESKNSRNKEWTDYIRSQTEQGKSIERIHIIPRELTDYLKFEIDWAYRYSQEAGEKISFVYREALPMPLKSLELPDFWLFDDSACLIQRYNDIGSWQGSDFLRSESGLQTLRHVRDVLFPLSFPLDQHPHMRSQRRGSAMYNRLRIVHGCFSRLLRPETSRAA
jgi:hypothetical protein